MRMASKDSKDGLGDGDRERDQIGIKIRMWIRIKQNTKTNQCNKP